MNENVKEAIEKRLKHAIEKLDKIQVVKISIHEDGKRIIRDDISHSLALLNQPEIKKMTCLKCPIPYDEKTQCGKIFCQPQTEQVFPKPLNPAQAAMMGIMPDQPEIDTDKIRKRWQPLEEHKETTVDYAISEIYTLCKVIDSRKANYEELNEYYLEEHKKVLSLAKEVIKLQAEIEKAKGKK